MHLGKFADNINKVNLKFPLSELQVRSAPNSVLWLIFFGFPRTGSELLVKCFQILQLLEVGD